MRVADFANYDAVFFDLDGTLYDDRSYDAAAYAEIARFFPAEPNMARRLTDLKTQRGRLDGNLLDVYCAERGLAPTDAARMVEIYRTFTPAELALEPTMAQLLRELEPRLLFLVTNGRAATQQKKINALALASRFTSVYICDGVRWPLKPDPTVFHHAQATFSFERAVMVGDSLAIDQGFARNAGIPFVYYSVIA